MRYFMIILFVFLSFDIIYSQPHISEIGFIDEEYVEIYSRGYLNLSGNFIYDDAGYNKSNYLEEVIVKNSSYYLIVGDDFLKGYDYSSLNCTIYATQKSGIGYYGLKDTSENITIALNSSMNLSWVKNYDYEFDNASLNFNEENSTYYKSIKSPCSRNQKSYSILDSNHTNTSAEENASEANSSLSCTGGFSIVPKRDIFEDRIEYSFITNFSNYTIEYWIENYRGDIVKDKRNTTNPNLKYYTPDDITALYYLKAALSDGNCTAQDSRLAIFYSPKTYDSPDEISSSSLLSNPDGESYIRITNEDEIKKREDDVLRYEIYKGDTRKRTVYFHLDGEEISSVALNKYTKVKGRLKLDLDDRSYNLSIRGLGLDEHIVIGNITKEMLGERKSKKSHYFEIDNLTTRASQINFTLDHNLGPEYIFRCYITYIRTKVSDVLEMPESGRYSLGINISKLIEKEAKDMYDLKLLCKYKLSSKDYYQYVSEKFEISAPKGTLRTISFSSGEILSKEENYDIFDISSSKEKTNTSKIGSLSQDIIKEDNSRESSFYFFLIALVLIVVTLLVMW